MWTYNSLSLLLHHLAIIKFITNWWAWELVPSKVRGDLKKIPGTAASFHSNPVSINQPCKRPPISTITLKKLQCRNLPDLIPHINHFLWGVGRAGHWIGDKSSDPQSSTEQANCKYGDQSSVPSKVVIYRDQRSRKLQLWWLELTCKHTARQALMAKDQRDHWTYWLDINF